MNPRAYIVAVVAFTLVIYGPIDRSWPAWLAIRTAYLLGIPAAVWFLLGYVWKIWKPDEASESRLCRALAGATSGVLLMLAILASDSDYHMECTKWVRTKDGQECVGDDVAVSGPDWGWVVMLALASVGAFWISSRSKEPK